MGYLAEVMANASNLAAWNADVEGMDGQDELFDALFAHEQKRWFDADEAAKQYQERLVRSAMEELVARSNSKAKVGRRPALMAYKEYKQTFLRGWAHFVTKCAKRDGLTMNRLAWAFGFTEDSEWRALQRGDCYRMTHQRFVSHSRWTVPHRGWNVLREGNLVRILDENLTGC